MVCADQVLSSCDRFPRGSKAVLEVKRGFNGFLEGAWSPVWSSSEGMVEECEIRLPAALRCNVDSKLATQTSVDKKRARAVRPKTLAQAAVSAQPPYNTWARCWWDG